MMSGGKTAAIRTQISWSLSNLPSRRPMVVFIRLLIQFEVCSLARLDVLRLRSVFVLALMRIL